MLSFFDAHRPSRRAFLQVGALGLGGLALPQLLQARAGAAERGTSLDTGKSVIFLFQHGGPSQFETFDPKMTAPQEIRSVTGEIPTTVPGLTFGGTFTRLARHAHRVAVVRSFQGGNGNHDLKPLVGPSSLNANIGSVYGRVAGPVRPSGMPTNCAIFPNAAYAGGPGPRDNFGRFNATGPLGQAYAPFIPGAGGDLQSNMRLNMPPTQLDDRRLLLSRLDMLRRDLDASGTLASLDRFQQQAFEIVLGGIADAFNLSREDSRLIGRYDTSRLDRPDAWRHKNNRNNYSAHARSLGKLLLLARRLCESGCGFVTVTTDFVWDMHSDVNNLPVGDGMELVGTPLDVAVSAFIEDVEARGLSDRILLVVCGEMGRTPRLNRTGGRDHWGRLGPLLIYGGGRTHGQIIGRSDRTGGEPADLPITGSHLVATILHYLLDTVQVRLVPGLPAEVARLVVDGTPIPQLS
jgi:hypothetical protein